MDQFLVRLSPNVRRSPRRIALRELSVTSPLRRSVTGNGVGVSTGNLVSLIPDPAASPDERIIQQRGPRSTAIRNIMSDMSKMETEEEDLPDLAATSLDDSGFDSPDGVLDCSTPMAPPAPSRHVTSLSAATRKRLQMSPTKDQAKRKRVPRKVKEVPLATSLKGLTQDQLIDIICGLVDRHVDLEAEIKHLAPAPDLEPLREKLTTLERNVYKSFPNTRWGSNRDAFCFRRVKSHLEQFKRDCTDMGKGLLTAASYGPTVDYVLMAWDFVDRLPDWDNFDHNKSKIQCFKNLAAQCLSVIKKAPFEKEQLHELQQRLGELEDHGQYMTPSLQQIKKTLDKLR